VVDLKSCLQNIHSSEQIWYKDSDGLNHKHSNDLNWKSNCRVGSNFELLFSKFCTQMKTFYQQMRDKTSLLKVINIWLRNIF
jgi:hypothetical protein